MALVSTTTVVQAITSGPPLNNQEFQGWYYNSDSSWEAIECPTSQSLLTTANFAQCCSFGATTCSTLWTSCDGSTAVGVSRNSCKNCASMSIYNQYGAIDQSPFTQIICGEFWLASTIYRNIVASTTELSVVTLSSAASATAMPMTGTGPTNTASPVSALMSGTAATVTAAAAATSTQAPSSGGNKAWIAGVVVGFVVAIALTAFVLWFFCIRKKRRTSSTHSNEHMMAARNDAYPQYTDGTATQSFPPVKPPEYYQPETYELSADRRRHELPTGQ